VQHSEAGRRKWLNRFFGAKAVFTREIRDFMVMEPLVAKYGERTAHRAMPPSKNPSNASVISFCYRRRSLLSTSASILLLDGKSFIATGYSNSDTLPVSWMSMRFSSRRGSRPWDQAKGDWGHINVDLTFRPTNLNGCR